LIRVDVRHTPESPSPDDLARLRDWRAALGDLLAAEIEAEKSWYKMGRADVQVLSDTPRSEVNSLSNYSSIVRNIKQIEQVRLYARPERRDEAVARISGR
jgi:hypothetical protein